MKYIKSHFLFSRQQRSGIVFLVLIITCLLGIKFFYDFSEDPLFDASSSEIVEIQKEIDSLRVLEIASRKPKIYPFNPNFITDYKGYTLGMSSEEIDRLLAFRKSNRWINSVSDFKKVTKVSDSLLNKISPFFKFPDWVTNPKPKSKYNQNKFSEKSFDQKIDLNSVSEEQLQKIYGIGKTLSKRIIAYRSKLDGFANDSQLYQVYGLSDAVVLNILNEFTVKTPKEIVKMNVNTVSASDLATIPGVSFEVAKRIWEFRILRGHFSSLEDLTKIEGVTKRKLTVIKLYLRIE